MALTDPLQWVVVAIFFGLVVVGGIVYLLFRVFRTLDRLDRYLQKKMETESEQSAKDSQ